MTKPFELFVAARYLTAKGKERFLSVITLISVGGVAVGVMALIVVLSVMNGFEVDLRDKILGTTAHISVLHIGKEGIRDWPAVAAKVRRVEGVTAVAPFVFMEGILSWRARWILTPSAPPRCPLVRMASPSRRMASRSARNSLVTSASALTIPLR